MRASLLAVPAYFDPLREAELWSRVTSNASALRMVVLNPASGPGPSRQASYATLTRRLRAAGICRLGYVNTGYGSRLSAEVRDECAAFRRWYDVDGVFLDQAASDVESLGAYAQYVRDARSLGCRTVVLNPGVYPHPGYADLADLVVTFEGDLEMHRKSSVPKWVMSLPSENFCHLVYDVPEHEVPAVRRRIARANAGTFYITDGVLANPWETVPTYWEKLSDLA